MSFGGWAINRATFDYIRKILPEGKTILELESGEGTKELAEFYKMFSVESHPKWLNKFKTTYIHAPMRQYNESYKAPPIDNNFAWYDFKVLEREIPKIKYDMIFVDGPEGIYGRGGFFKHLDMFNTNVPIIFDDIERKPEFELLTKVSEALKKEYIILEDGKTGVIL